jgi:hypothetical protein
MTFLRQAFRFFFVFARLHFAYGLVPEVGVPWEDWLPDGGDVGSLPGRLPVLGWPPLPGVDAGGVRLRAAVPQLVIPTRRYPPPASGASSGPPLSPAHVSVAARSVSAVVEALSLV